jgi:hypothetical protein
MKINACFYFMFNDKKSWSCWSSVVLMIKLNIKELVDYGKKKVIMSSKIYFLINQEKLFVYIICYLGARWYLMPHN